MIEVLESKLVYEGWLKISEDKYRNSRTNKIITYSVLEADDSIIVLPITRENNVIVASEYRHPIGDNIYNLPSGRINRGETPMQAAVRELKEETGYTGKLEQICDGFIWPGITNMRITCFVATELVLGQRNQDEDEDIQIVEIPYGKLLEEAKNSVQKNFQLNYVLFLYELLKGNTK